jgi:hypothetical protein
MAVQRLGKQTRGGSFANATGAREKIGVMKPLMLDGIAQSARDGFLPGNFSESLRAPFACDYLVGHESDE